MGCHDMTKANQIEQAEYEQRKLAEALWDTAAALNSTLDMDDVLDRILSNVGKVVPHDAANIMLIGEHNTVYPVRMRGYAERGMEEIVRSLHFALRDTPNFRIMIETGEPLIISDTQAYPGWVGIPGIDWIRSYAGTPLRVKGQVVGFLSLDSATPGFFTPAHVNRLQAFANQAASAIENARLYQRAVKEAERREVLYQVTQAISASVDREQIAKAIHQAAARVMPVEAVVIALLINDGKEVKEIYLYDHGQRWPGEQYPLGPGLTSYIISTGRSLCVDNINEERLLKKIGAKDFGIPVDKPLATIAVPLQLGGKVSGMLSVQSYFPSHYTTEDRQLLEMLAIYAANSFENARLYEATQAELAERKQMEQTQARHAAQMAALYETSLEINSQSDLPQLLHAITRRAAELLGTHMGGLYLIAHTGNYLELVVSYNLPGQLVGTHLGLGEGVSGRVIQLGQPIMVEDYTTWEGRAPVYNGTPFRRVLGVPLKWGNETIGVINVTDDKNPGSFSEDEIRLVSLFADQAALAIKNARLLSEAQRRTEELVVLNRIGQAVISNLELEQVLQTLHEQCQQVLLMDAFYVAVYDKKTGRIHYPFYTDRDQNIIVSPSDIVASPGLSGEVILSGKTIYLPDTLAPDISSDHNITRTGGTPTRSFVGVPLSMRDQVIGVLSMQSYQPNAYTPDQIRLLETIADRVAAAIEHARLFEEIQENTRYLSLLNEITRAALQATDMTTMLQTLADRMGTLFNADGCYITLWEETQQQTIPTAAYGALRDTYSTTSSPPGEVTMTASVLHAGYPLVAEDVFNSPYISPSIAAEYLPRSLLGLPLVVDEVKLGAVLIGFNQTHHFTTEEIARGEQAAAQIALAITKSRLAITDHLTKLYNRRGLFEIGKREIERSRRYGKSLSVIMLDIDHFKRVNDMYGHAVGDEVLCTVAERCRENIRRVDTLGRYGGEEFAILLPESSLSAACQIAERLRRCISETPIPTERAIISATVSIGVASIEDDTPDLDVLINRSDDAMYAAKRAGRNRVVASGTE
jgi:two-component system cell cycle response regulator